MKLKKLIFFTTFIIPTFSSALIAHAGKANGNLQVKARIAGGCTIKNTSDAILDFGTIDDLNKEQNIAKTADDMSIQIQCSKGIDYSIGLGGGHDPEGPEGDNAVRHMRFGNQIIRYALTSDAAAKAPWTLASRITGAGDGNVQTYPVYGKLFQAETPVAGDYTDTVTIEVKY